jgi:signal transduction histidine kinase
MTIPKVSSLFFARLASGAAGLLGAVVLIGWLLKSETLAAVIPGSPPINPNVAAGMLVCGIVLGLLSLTKPLRLLRVSAMALAGAVVILGLFSLLEYFFRWDVGMDRWLFRFAEAKPSNPTRMRPLTGVSFILIGSALLAASRSSRFRVRVPLAAALSSALVAAGVLALVGILLELVLGRDWNLMGMSLSSVTIAMGFLLLGSGLLALLQSTCGLTWSLDAVTTAGFVLGLLLMVSVAAAAFTFARHMQETNTRVIHREEVLKRVQEAMTEMADLASRERIYLIIGDEQLLRERPETKATIEQTLGEIRKLTSASPKQQHHLDGLAPLIRQRIEWEEQMIVTRREQGLAAVRQILSTGSGLRVSDEIARLLNKIQDEEYRLLELDQNQGEKVEIATFSILPLGVFFSLGILSLCIFFLNSGMTEQAQTERTLRTTESEVRQLNLELEERVARRTADLQAANRELEAFSYSVSHDLRAPLRAVDGFSQAALEDYGAQLPEEGRRYLQTIRDGAQRMAVLIDDLLTFSRLGRLPLRKQAIDMSKLAHEALGGLEELRTGRTIDVRIGELLPCQGDPALLKQVWVNLLSNAVKYSRKRDAAVVEIGARRDSGETIYSVSDNGSGFDMQYADKLFGVFQRLHRAEEFEGTGVGLAIVKRVIHRHGGRVWAEAAVDRGATFCFTLGGGVTT